MNKQETFYKMAQAMSELGSIFKYEIAGIDDDNYGIDLSTEDGHLAAITPFNLTMQYAQNNNKRK